MSNDLMLHQEVLLLALRDDQGTLSNGMIQYAMAGAMLSELLLHQKIVTNDDKQQTVAVVDESPLGDSVTDEFLDLIINAKKNRGLQYWIGKGASIKQLYHRVAETLCNKGILKRDERKILFLLTQKIYPELNASFEEAIRARMAEVMFNEAVKADERTAILIAIASHATLLPQNFPPVELKQHKQRIKSLAKGEGLAAAATGEAIAAVQAAMMAATMIPIMVAATSN